MSFSPLPPVATLLARSQDILPAGRANHPPLRTAAPRPAFHAGANTALPCRFKIRRGRQQRKLPPASPARSHRAKPLSTEKAVLDAPASFIKHHHSTLWRVPSYSAPTLQTPPRDTSAAPDQNSPHRTLLLLWGNGCVRPVATILRCERTITTTMREPR